MHAGCLSNHSNRCHCKTCRCLWRHAMDRQLEGHLSKSVILYSGFFFAFLNRLPMHEMRKKCLRLVVVALLARLSSQARRSFTGHSRFPCYCQKARGLQPSPRLRKARPLCQWQQASGQKILDACAVPCVAPGTGSAAAGPSHRLSEWLCSSQHTIYCGFVIVFMQFIISVQQRIYF